MPSGVYKKTKEHKRKISESLKGRVSTFKGHEHTTEAIKRNILAHIGKIVSEETRRKLSKANKGKHKYWTGKKFSKEHRKKIKDAISKSKTLEIRRKSALYGKNNGNWKGGITSAHQKIRDSVEYKTWRLSVFQRDNWKCKKCNKKGYLEAHHIENFNTNIELRTMVSNGITLCYKCHRKFHSIYGNKNTVEQLIKFLN